MPLPVLAPRNDAALANAKSWLAHLEARAATTPPPPGRAASEAAALAAEHVLLGPRRPRIW